MKNTLQYPAEFDIIETLCPGIQKQIKVRLRARKREVL